MSECAVMCIWKSGKNCCLYASCVVVQACHLPCMQGVQLNVGDTIKTVYVTLIAVSGDNIGSQFLGKFKQLASAMRQCRWCMATKDDVNTKVRISISIHTYIYVYWLIYAKVHGCLLACILIIKGKQHYIGTHCIYPVLQQQA